MIVLQKLGPCISRSDKLLERLSLRELAASANSANYVTPGHGNVSLSGLMFMLILFTISDSRSYTITSNFISVIDISKI